MDVTPIPKPPKRQSKSKRGINPQKEKHSGIVDPDAVKAARRSYCVYCGLSKSSMTYHVHHIVKRSQAGGDVEDNLINLCAECHERAHNRMVNDKPPITANDLRDMLQMDLKI